MAGGEIEVRRQRGRIHLLRRRLVEVLLALGRLLIEVAVELNVGLLARVGRGAVDVEHHVELPRLLQLPIAARYDACVAERVRVLLLLLGGNLSGHRLDTLSDDDAAGRELVAGIVRH
jgi:hypothetical protein